MKKYVACFDICSSTSILENLQSNDKINLYNELVDILYLIIELAEKEYGIEKYKFLGDGFIFVADEESNPEKLLNCCMGLYKAGNILLRSYIDKYIDVELPRIGFTCGLAFGSIYEYHDRKKSKEYYGRVLNLAARMQAALSDKRDVNKVLLQKEVYDSIKSVSLKKACKKVSRDLKNLNIGNGLICYEFYPMLLTNVPYKMIDNLINLDRSEIPTDTFDYFQKELRKYEEKIEKELT